MTSPVLVTGAAGFAGSHLVDRLDEVLPRDRPLVAWRRPGGTSGRPTSGRVSWVPVDLLDRDAVDVAIAAARPTVVYHCAGSPHVATSWSDSLRPLHANVLSTEHLILAIERHVPRARLVVPSSAQVYAQGDGPIDEDGPLRPQTPYGVSKLAQELLATRAQRDRGFDAVVARPFNHIGPRQEATFVAAAFAKQVAEVEAGRVDPIIKVGNLDARRDLTDVRDTVRAYQAIAERGEPGRIYNVCSGRAVPIRELLDRLVAIAGVPVKIVVDTTRLRPSDTPVFVGNPSRIERELGWRAEIPLDRTLGDLLAYWREQVSRAGTRP